MSNPGQPNGAESIEQVGFKLPADEIETIEKLAHEASDPGAHVTISDFGRAALREFIEDYQDDPEQYDVRRRGAIRADQGGDR